MYCTISLSAKILPKFAKRLVMAEKTKIIQPQAGFQEKFVSTNVDMVVGGGVLNCGKAQPLDSLICTPTGFVRMGDLNVGDIISDTKGGTQVVEEVFERGVLDCKEIIFDDGSVVKCCPEHLWTVWNKTSQKYETIELREIMVNPAKFSVALPDAILFNPNGEKIIHPYLLGVLIGDGYLGGGNSSIKIDTDREIIDRAFALKSFNYIWHQYKKRRNYALFTDPSIRNGLRVLNLLGKRSHEKFIPTEYLCATIDERIELLRGLFDTDGHNDKRSYRIEYSTVSEQLANDVCFLVRSLGGKVTVSTKVGSYKNDIGERVCCKKVFRLSCRFKDKNRFFTLSRKKSDIKQGKRIHLNFAEIKDGGKAQMRCIRVSNPNHLYITNNFIPTHNTFAAVLSVAEPSNDGRFRGLFLRNNLADARAAGGILDTFKEIYGDSIEVVESGEPHVTFKSGARIDVTHVADQSRDKILQRFKGRQYDFIYFDEGTGFEWSCFTAIYSRNRGTAKWTGRVRMTTNPDKNHWLRRFLDWYIGPDGFIREDREGVVRYFFINGETVNDVIWGDSKESVYQQCKIQIDRVLAKVNGKTGNATYEDLIKSFTFYLGRMSENKASIGNNSGYVGSVALTGGRSAQQLLEGNWNVSPDTDLDAPIQPHVAATVFDNDPCINNDKWITVDLADVGDDNTIILIWNGFHVIDYLILTKSTPRMNAEKILYRAELHGVADSHIIYDATRAVYINDYIPEAVPYISGKSPRGRYSRIASRLKDECYLRLVEMIKRGRISFADKIADAVYIHDNMSIPITIQTEFIEECSVVRFDEGVSGKKQLLSKKQMNKHLGKNRSMDLLDACSMRMLPVLDAEYGEELMYGVQEVCEDETNIVGRESIYDETTWA